MSALPFKMNFAPQPSNLGLIINKFTCRTNNIFKQYEHKITDLTYNSQQFIAKISSGNTMMYHGPIKKFITESSYGQVMFGKKMKGPEYISLDVNSLYGYAMSQLNIPLGKPVMYESANHGSYDRRSEIRLNGTFTRAA
jgi:hypothetical protein